MATIQERPLLARAWRVLELQNLNFTNTLAATATLPQNVALSYLFEPKLPAAHHAEACTQHKALHYYNK